MNRSTILATIKRTDAEGRSCICVPISLDGRWWTAIDMRDLDQVLAHVHEAEIQIVERDPPPAHDS